VRLVLVVVVVAHRTLGPSSSATERALPSSAVQARCWSRPIATTQAIAQLDPDCRPDPLPEELRLYDLRHTAASLMIRQRASVKRGRPRRRPGEPGTDPARTNGRTSP